MAIAPIKADMKAPTVSAVQVRSANVAPVTTMDSPSAMMMNPALRSAIWPPSMVQSSMEDAPYFGIQKRAAGDRYSIPRATPHRTSLDCPSAMPPAIQNTADAESQASMRIAFLCKEGRLGGIHAKRKAVRPTCIAAYAKADH